MAWAVLVVAGLLEVVWAFAMKQSHGFTRLWPTVVMLVTVLLSFVLLSWSMRSIPLGTAYTVWSGIGALGAFVVGVVVLGESASPMRIIAILLLLSGIFLLKFSGPN